MGHTSNISFPGLGIGEFKLNNVAFTVFGRPVMWYGVIICIGIILAFAYVAYRAGKAKIKLDDVVDTALIVALYLTRNNRKYQCIIGAVMMLFELTAPLAFVLIWFYNGQRGRCPQWVKWAFYGFYPVHLSILAVVTNWVL